MRSDTLSFCGKKKSAIALGEITDFVFSVSFDLGHYHPRFPVVDKDTHYEDKNEADDDV
jgi:hypothetical protein